MENFYHIDHAYMQNPLPFGEIFLVQIGRMFCKADTVIERHVHLNWFELTIVTDGEGIIKTNGKEVPVKSGDIHLSYPADLHEIISSPTKPLKYDFCSFFTEKESWKSELELIMQTFSESNSRVFSNERIKALVSDGIAELCQENQDTHTVLTGIFQQIAVYLIRAFKEKETPILKGNQAESLCYQIMNYIDTHIFSLHSLPDLCGAFPYNYSYLSALFKKTTGRTLLNYYQSAKLKRAKSLLKENKLSVSEISEHLGYSSVYAFSKAFKKQYGVCPTGVRN